MKTQTRRAAAVAGIAILVGAAGSGALSAQGQTEQQLTHDAVILISAISSDQHGRGDRTADHHRTHRAGWLERDRNSQSSSGTNGTVQGGTASKGGVEAAAGVDARAGVEVVLKSLPGVDANRVDSAGIDTSSTDSAGESCS